MVLIEDEGATALAPMERGVMRTAAISTHGLSKHYGDVVALDGLDLMVEPGEIFGFLGPNASGKTTTIRLLLGLIHPTAGSAEILGIPVHDVARAHRHVAYVPGDVAFWPQLTGLETLELLGNVSGTADAAFRAELIERLGFDPSIKVRSYSKGNRQKLALVAALQSRADVLLLDEPTSGLDPLMAMQFKDIALEAAARGQTVFLSSHILTEVQHLCSRVGILRAGKLVRVAALDELRELEHTIVELVVEGDLPVLDGTAGLVSVEPLPGVAGGLRVTISGSPQALLQRLATLQVTSMRTVEPTLEEVFLAYY